MIFDEILSQVQDLLQREQRVSYRGLKRRFALDDEYIEDLKEELIGAKRIAVDEDGRFIVWTGNQNKGDTAKRGKGEQDGPESKVQSQKAQAPDPSPVSYQSFPVSKLKKLRGFRHRAVKGQQASSFTESVAQQRAQPAEAIRSHQVSMVAVPPRGVLQTG